MYKSLTIRASTYERLEKVKKGSFSDTIDRILGFMEETDSKIEEHEQRISELEKLKGGY